MTTIKLRPRLCIMTDIGGDPDDTQSLIRLLVYSNAFEIKGLLPTASGTPGECEDASPRPDMIHKLIDAYGEVLPNLQRFEAGWPEAEYLHGLVHSGKAARGMSAVGEGHDTPASKWFTKCVDEASPEDRLNLSIWGGQTDLAQALWRVNLERGAEGLADFISRFRVYDIADQDGLAGLMYENYPEMFYILSHNHPGTDKRTASFRGMYLGGDESLTSREWIEANVRSRGPLGALYPTETWTEPNPYSCMKEGDTPSWFYFLPAGGNNPDDPTQPGWGGHFVRPKDGWFKDVPTPTGDEARATVHYHRPAFQADFAKRMAWCAGIG